MTDDEREAATGAPDDRPAPATAADARGARRRDAVQLAGSLAAAALIAVGTVVAVTAKLGTTSVAALEAQEERAKEREDALDERRDAREDRRGER